MWPIDAPLPYGCCSVPFVRWGVERVSKRYYFTLDLRAHV
jgi:hypothetical protein